MRRVTADKNILISALQSGGKPLTLLDIAQDGRIELAISDAILTETLRVLRDKFHRTTEWLQEAENHLREITSTSPPPSGLTSSRPIPTTTGFSNVPSRLVRR